MQPLNLTPGLRAQYEYLPSLKHSVFFISFKSYADDWQLPEFNGLVAGAISQDNLPYKQVDTQTQPSLLVSAMGQLRTHQYLDASQTNLTDQDRDKSIELGPQVSMPLGNGFVSQFSVLQDISAKHKGQEYEAAIYKRFAFDDLRIIATLAAQYQSQDLMDYYVGTDTYQPKAELTQEIELLGVYDINDNWSAVGIWRYYQHGDEFKNSPLTNNQTTQRVALGIGYHF